MEYEARLREMDEKHQHELQELENSYQQNIMGEVERYQVMFVTKVSPLSKQTLDTKVVVERLPPPRNSSPGVVLCLFYSGRSGDEEV